MNYWVNLTIEAIAVGILVLVFGLIIRYLIASMRGNSTGFIFTNRGMWISLFLTGFMPILSIVGSTRNQWPIIIEENTDATSKIGKKLYSKFWPIRLNEASKNETMLMKTKYFLSFFSKEYK